jgi:hypothetical protein
MEKAKVKTNRIKSLSEFFKAIENLPQKPGSSLYYRGHEDLEYDLKPSIYRKNSFIKNEHIIFNEILREKPEQFIDDSSTLDKLIRMQHYSLPTRLLDITRNSLVALYFACVNSNDEVNDKKDGEVVVLSIPGNLAKYDDNETPLVLSDLCKLTPAEKRKNINPKYINKIVPIKAKMKNERIKAQDGLFLLYGINEKGECPEINNDWVIKSRIIIDKKAKENIKRQLKSISISPDFDNASP